MDRTSAPSASFEQFSAERLNRDRARITRDWVEKLSSQLGVRPRRVLPTEELLDNIPPVLGKAAEFLLAPDEGKITAQKLVTDQMQETARLRRRQGYDVQEIIREFDELAQILDGAALHWLDEYEGTPDPKAVGRVFGRLNRVPMLMGEITVGVFREEELESRHTTARQLRHFTETLMHQLKTPLGAAEGAALHATGREPEHCHRRPRPGLGWDSLREPRHPSKRQAQGARQRSSGLDGGDDDGLPRSVLRGRDPVRCGRSGSGSVQPR